MSDHDELGSLAQSTRSADLNSTRNVLFLIGGLTIALNAFMFANANDEVRNAGVQAADHDRIVGIVRMIYGAAIALGTVFIISGALIKKYPVPLTILSLVLYVGATAGFAFLDPTTLVHGIIFKVIIVVALAKSVQTAMAYQRDRDAGLT
ncbi:MAG: hypothetical protein R3C49_09710 [Planctomycetaceae bacterium]